MTRQERAIPDGTYVELVASLFATRSPTLIMTALFVTIGGTVVVSTRDVVLACLLALGLVASMVRVGILLHDRRPVRRPSLTIGDARRIERRFAVSYLSFAGILGLFGGRVLALPGAELHMLMLTTLVGYSSGVATGTALRPRIALGSIALAVLPAMMVAALLHREPSYILTAVALAAFMTGGTRSILTRARMETASITARRTFGALARQDQLTGLANRLALAEHFATADASPASGGIALHCLDLDRFKPVNDRLGHAAGDAILVAVAGRLQSLARGDDLAARIGGDEFVLVQTGIRHAHEPETLARMIERELALPYMVNGEAITIGSSVGIAVHRPGEALEPLIRRADDALRAVKVTRSAATTVSDASPSVGRLHLVG